MSLKQIISGGQTGVDIAAIDAAITKGFPYGGLLPMGRLCETGTVSSDYTDFTEAVVKGYLHRTRKNVQNADGTLVFSAKAPTGGTLRTIDFAKQYNKPYLLVLVSNLLDFDDEKVHAFIKDNNIKVLNVAGPKETKSPGIHTFVYTVMLRIISKYIP